MTLQGSKTEQNLLSTFAGESQARNRYTFFASVAKKAGLEQIAGIFLETADNEKEHAKRAFQLLGLLKDTATNLAVAMAGEHEEWSSIYRAYAETAKREGFDEIATFFTEIGEVEEEHEKRYGKLLKNVEDGMVFKRDQPVKWHCRNCGYIHEGTEAPTVCPACLHPQAYYEVLCENY